VIGYREGEMVCTVIGYREGGMVWTVIGYREGEMSHLVNVVWGDSEGGSERRAVPSIHP
jgi:hypothetical protein